MALWQKLTVWNSIYIEEMISTSFHSFVKEGCSKVTTNLVVELFVIWDNWIGFQVVEPLGAELGRAVLQLW